MLDLGDALKGFVVVSASTYDISNYGLESSGGLGLKSGAEDSETPAASIKHVGSNGFQCQLHGTLAASNLAPITDTFTQTLHNK